MLQRAEDGDTAIFHDIHKNFVYQIQANSKVKKGYVVLKKVKDIPKNKEIIKEMYQQYYGFGYEISSQIAAKRVNIRRNGEDNTEDKNTSTGGLPNQVSSRVSIRQTESDQRANNSRGGVFNERGYRGNFTLGGSGERVPITSNALPGILTLYESLSGRQREEFEKFSGQIERFCEHSRLNPHDEQRLIQIAEREATPAEILAKAKEISFTH